jgi:ATP-binding cassette, subfamily B, heavy metal transporter
MTDQTEEDGSAEAELEDGKEGGHLQTLKRLARYLWPAGEWSLKARVIISVVFLIGAKVVTVYLAFFYKDAVDALDALGAGKGDNIPLIYGIPLAAILAYGAARFMAIGFAELRDLTFIRVSQNALRRVALETFQHLHTLSLAFHLDRRTGGLSRAIERGTRAIDFLLRFMLFSILPTFIEIFLVVGIFLLHFGIKYAVVLAGAIGLYILMTFTVTDWRLQFRRTMNKEDSAANTKAIDSLINFETVKYFGNEAHEASRYDVALVGYQQAAVKSQLSLSLLNTGQAFIVNAGLIAAMALAAADVVAGNLSLGDFVLANTLLIQLFIPLNLLGFVYREIKQSLVDMEQMFTLLTRSPEVADNPGAAVLKCNGGAISFRNVTFRYQANRTILKNISFDVPAGKTVALVGPSGAGKSTISRILFRFYDIAEGSVTIDGIDIRDITQQSLRASIGIVPQDTVLFNDSIFYNIQYGRMDASREEVEAAGRLAQMDQFVARQPDGYETMVGERGLKLSGGEKQRVAIARTILKSPPILLLDEATSALDTGTEREIQAALKTVAKDRTTLVIAHRLSTIIDADQILVLDDGVIVERGSHEALLSLGGIYATMWARQKEAAEVSRRLKDLEADALVGEARFASETE